jgi:hypothetical protein
MAEDEQPADSDYYEVEQEELDSYPATVRQRQVSMPHLRFMRPPLPHSERVLRPPMDATPQDLRQRSRCELRSNKEAQTQRGTARAQEVRWYSGHQYLFRPPIPASARAGADPPGNANCGIPRRYGTGGGGRIF